MIQDLHQLGQIQVKLGVAADEDAHLNATESSFRING